MAANLAGGLHKEVKPSLISGRCSVLSLAEFIFKAELKKFEQNWQKLTFYSFPMERNFSAWHFHSLSHIKISYKAAVLRRS